MSRAEPERPESMPWRDNIEAMAVAIIMAVMLKYFIVEAYKIPTGSMQPTLFGQTFHKSGGLEADGGVFDRILVDKLSYHFRDPERFEVVVFKYPLDRAKNFVKRLVGLPGEELRVHRGDLWTRPDGEAEWSLQRRPDHVMEDVWKDMDRGLEDQRPLWKTEGGLAADGRALRADAAGSARYIGHGSPNASGAITDVYVHGYPEAIREQVGVAKPPLVVGDLRVTGRLEPKADCARVVVVLEDGPLEHRFVLPGPAAPADERVRIESGPRIESKAQRDDPEPASGSESSELGPLRAGEALDFAVENLDDRLTLRVEGEVLCRLEVPSVDLALATTGIRIELEGGGATLEGLRCFRDIYYKPAFDGSNQWRIPEGQYFMMGDNTQDSSDSREWAWYTLAWDGEGSEGKPVRGNRRVGFGRRPEEIPHDANPVEFSSDSGMLTFFRSEWGERYAFPSSEKRPVLGSTGQRAPFVPRELITGRAVAVFWPIKPWAGINRLKRVD